MNQKFHKLEFTGASPAAPLSGFSSGFSWAGMGRYGVGVLALLLTFFMVIRPLMRRLDEQPLSAVQGVGSILPGVAARGEASEGAEGEEQREKPSEEVLAEWLDTVSSGARHVTRGEVNGLISSDIQHSVVTLQAWIREEA